MDVLFTDGMIYDYVARKASSASPAVAAGGGPQSAQLGAVLGGAAGSFRKVKEQVRRGLGMSELDPYHSHFLFTEGEGSKVFRRRFEQYLSDQDIS